MNIRGILGLTVAAIALTVFSPAEILAQDSYVQTPVTVSKEKVKVGGKLCWSHVVLERQTLYSISRAYGVSIEDIYRYNPSVRKDGLKKNAIILIPVVGDDYNEAGDTREKQESSGKVPAAKASDEVPEAKTSDKTPETKPSDNAQEAAQEPVIHTVRWYETIESIARKYDISVESIMKANRLSSPELKSRQKLVIPANETAEMEAETEISGVNDSASGISSPQEGNAQEGESADADEQTADGAAGLSADRSVRFALVLPFMASSEKPSSSSIDFYCGALLAARELGLDSINVHIDVFDTGSDPIAARSFADDDFIIGPVSADDIRKVHETVGDDIAIISPLDPKAAALTAEFPKLVQVPTPHELQYADLIQWIADETRDGDITVLISEKGGKESAAMKNFTEILEISGLKYRTLQYSLLEGRDIIDSLKEVTVESPRVNRFIIASESEAFVNDVFRNIKLLSRENRDVAVFCHSKVRGYDIEVENLHSNRLHVSLAYYIDYDNPETISFVKAYRALFDTEPTQFSFQGYDVTKYFCRLRASFGGNWLRFIGDRQETGLQTSFNFRDSSRINEGVRRIEYQSDYKIQ